MTETLERLAQGRTTIVIAHRFSTIDKADCILVLDGGAVVQRGKHSELMSRRASTAIFSRHSPRTLKRVWCRRLLVVNVAAGIERKSGF